MSEKLPWFKFFATDWISDARLRNMSSRQKGWLIDLLAYAWQEDGLPESVETLHGLTGYDGDYQDATRIHDALNDYTLVTQVEQEFLAVVDLFRTKLPDERITHPKIHQQRMDMQVVKDKRTKAARHAAESRWDASRMRRASKSHTKRRENQKQNQIKEAELLSSTEGVLNSPGEFHTAAAIAAAEPPLAAAAGPQALPHEANGNDAERAAWIELEREGCAIPQRYAVNEFGKYERTPESLRIDAALEHARPRIRAARMPVAFAKKVILDALKGA